MNKLPWSRSKFEHGELQPLMNPNIIDELHQIEFSVIDQMFKDKLRQFWTTTNENEKSVVILFLYKSFRGVYRSWAPVEVICVSLEIYYKLNIAVDRHHKLRARLHGSNIFKYLHKSGELRRLDTESDIDQSVVCILNSCFQYHHKIKRL